MEERIEVKEKEALIEKREVYEQGLKEEAVVVNEQRDMCYVLLTDQSGLFHLHHYFLIDTQIDTYWVISYDVQRKSAVDTIKELLHKNI